MNLQALLATLDGDDFRKGKPFSPEISTVSELLLNPYARNDERQLAIKAWLAKHQPCVFGQVAARADNLYIAIVTQALFDEGEDAIRQFLALEKKTWKQWSLGAEGRHGFVAVFATPQLHYAAPNKALKNVSVYLRDMFIEISTKDPAGNDICHDWLYLGRPGTQEFVKFRVILDFFASAGDGRWWHDHRFPGGVAFTLNSLGHMVRTKEWYQELRNPTEWAARMAMLTIANAFDHPESGKATHLLDLRDNQPFKSATCPFGSPEKAPATLKGRDWTTYQGSHHTDHSIREEFFDRGAAPDQARGDHLLDFSYIAGGTEGENAELMNGVPVSEEEVFGDIGNPKDWRRRKPVRFAAMLSRFTARRRPHEEERKIGEALSICQGWLRESDRPGAAH